MWDGCEILITDRLEKIQSEAPRIVTGLPDKQNKNRLFIPKQANVLKIRN